VTGDAYGYKLAVPLPSQGRQVFSLPTKGPIRTVFDVMRIDDNTITSIDLLDVQGDRISRSILTEDLIKADFKLKVNDKVYDVKPPARSLLGKRAVITGGTIMDKPQFQKVKDYVTSLKDAQTITVDAYFSKCQDLGIDKEQATEFLHVMNKLGVVLHVPEGLDLRTTIFLQPKRITDSIQSTFNLQSIKLSHEERVNLLAALKAELAPLAETRNQLFHKADRRVQLLAWAIFFGMCGQFFLFARFTWWDFSWDVMEPVTYFTTVTEGAIFGYMYYLVNRDEYTNMGFRDILTKKSFQRLARKNNFDSAHYEGLKKKISELETDIYYTLNQTTFSPAQEKDD